MPIALTPAEQLVDRVLAKQRAKGRNAYGKGLDHRDAYDWQRMAIEELVDAVQYLCAENLRLRDRCAVLDEARGAEPLCATEIVDGRAYLGAEMDLSGDARSVSLRLIRTGLDILGRAK